MSTLTTTYLYSDYDPVKYYDSYITANNTLQFYIDQTFYKNVDFFDGLGYPLPDLFPGTGKWNNLLYFQYWSMLLESPFLKAAMLWTFSATFVFLLMSIYFFMTIMKNDGFEGFEWNKLPENIDTTIKPMTW